ncbi:hypothetical protein C1H46_001579 [Malus baccata]|uniref:FIST C-domain domain-containing protein n=1 Tax=Malus baccata TaxID=106549 RepID=A0A540NQQ3_MALBA|nr:hypothetical protein C1H46_001579 [Malus baccata]
MFCSHKRSRGGEGRSMAAAQLKTDREQGVFSRITEKIGSGIPIITNRAMGLIGTDVNCAHGNSARNPEINGGLVVSVGFVPGLKVEIFPLPSPRHAPHLLMMEHFVRDILSYSGPLPPSCMMMFGDKHFDMNLVVAALDAIMPDKTAIVGDASASFMYTRRNETGNYSSDLFYIAGAALVFVKDQHKPDYMGEIEFHVTLSPGLMPFGPQIKTISSYETPTHSSWISAVMSEFEGVFIDSHTILRELRSQLGMSDIYTGVTKRRQYHNGAGPPVSMTTLNFHEVRGGYGDYILVDGVGIQPDDVFFFYHSDAATAMNTVDYASDNLQTLVHNDSDIQREVFGGFIFSSNKRGISLFNRRNVDCKPFADNFPGVPIAGMFGNGEIACGALLGEEENQELGHPRCCVHACSSVYLAMTYVPPQAPYYLE